MVTVLNKWPSCCLIGCLFSILAFAPQRGLIIPLFGTGGHPFHVSTTEINHNATDKTLEISCRIFVDDFESCLSKHYHIKADLTAASVKTNMDTLVKKYLSTHLQIKADGKAALIQYLGFEKEDEAVNVYFEADNIVTVKKVEINNFILHDLYNDQVNIIHVVVGGTRKSTKLDYPNKEAAFSF